jgi:hypothetical protein
MRSLDVHQDRQRATIVRTDTGPTFEYDVAKWGSRCHHPDSGGPLTCPGLQEVVKAWLCGS